MAILAAPVSDRTKSDTPPPPAPKTADSVDPTAEVAPVPEESSQVGNEAEPEGLEADPPSGVVAPDPLEEARLETGRLRDQLLRTAADFDNFRKRSRRELVDAERKGREDLLRELLPVFDNLERAQAHSDTATDVKSLVEGVAMVLRQFYDTLSRGGIERMTTVGSAFDPTFQEAIQQIETLDHEPGVVAAEVQAGYRMGERLIRPAMVVVAKRPGNGA